MAKFKIGTCIGKTDAGYNELKVGDTIRNKHTGLCAVINNYGTPIICNSEIKVSKFVSDDWLLDTPWDTKEKLEREFGKGMEMNEAPAAPVAPEPIEEPNPENEIHIIEGHKEEQPGDEELFVKAPLQEAEMHARATEAVKLLRSLGYEVSASKKVVCTVTL